MSKKAAVRKKSGAKEKWGNKSYECICGKSFTRKDNLKRHERGRCRLCCYMCKKQLKTKIGLENHIKSAHRNVFERDFTCELCRKEFSCNASRQAHFNEDHIEDLSYKVVTNQYRGKHMVFRKFFTNKNAHRMDFLLEDEQQKEMVDVLHTMLSQHSHIKWSMNTHLLLSKLDEEGKFQGKRDYHIPLPIRQSYKGGDTVVYQMHEATQQLMDRLEDIELEGSGFVFVAYMKNDINVYSLND